MKQPSVASQQRLIERINRAYQVGDKIQVRQDDGKVVERTMRHESTLLGGHTAVIWVEEHSGCYAADRVVF